MHEYLIRHYEDGQHVADVDQYATEQDVVELIIAHNSEDDWDTEDSARVIVRGRWSKLHLGPDEDRDVVTRLDEPVYYDSVNGEYLTETEIAEIQAHTVEREPFDCRAGIDYPGTL